MRGGREGPRRVERDEEEDEGYVDAEGNRCMSKGRERKGMEQSDGRGKEKKEDRERSGQIGQIGCERIKVKRRRGVRNGFKARIE